MFGSKFTFIYLFFIGILLLFFVCSCSNSDLSSSDKQQTDNKSEAESAQDCADEVCRSPEVEKDDIIIVYDPDQFVTACYTFDGEKAVYMYDGDYPGSYDNLDFIDEKTFDNWKAVIYRKKIADDSAHSSVDLDNLAQSIFEAYTDKYGSLKAGSYICLYEPDGSLYQYVTLSDDTTEYINAGDFRYDLWRSSANADDYWVKFYHDDPYETSWEVYEYDTVCSTAFQRIADLIDKMDDVRDEMFFVYQKTDRRVIMIYSEGALSYVQPVDFDKMLDELTEYDISSIKDAPKYLSVYINK